jgi:C1A family cysteine protease
MKSLLIIALCIVSALAVRTSPDVDQRAQFALFQQKYNKVYASADETERRFQIFKTNLAKAAEIQKRETGTAKYGMTKFSDLTTEEFTQKYLMPKSIHANMTIDASKVFPRIPDSVRPLDGMDWRDKGAITAVYNQEQCGSCWAFSASETVESYWHLCGHGLPNLSQQQVVDCDTTSYGCNGGWTEHAYDYLIKAGGQDSLKSYPYDAVDGSCKFKKADVVAVIGKWSYVTTSKDETAMLNWVTSKGPVSVCVDAETWSSYQGGVLKTCGKSIDHCVQITGYSTISNLPAWHVRNSWGTDWGNSGYIYVERGHDVCAIAEDVTAVTCA